MVYFTFLPFWGVTYNPHMGDSIEEAAAIPRAVCKHVNMSAIAIPCGPVETCIELPGIHRNH